MHHTVYAQSPLPVAMAKCLYQASIVIPRHSHKCNTLRVPCFLLTVPSAPTRSADKPNQKYKTTRAQRQRRHGQDVLVVWLVGWLLRLFICPPQSRQKKMFERLKHEPLQTFLKANRV
nr:hypothetical protein 8D4.140 [imported] - Neurospora crassa [Neurospora crassa]